VVTVLPRLAVGKYPGYQEENNIGIIHLAVLAA